MTIQDLLNKLRARLRLWLGIKDVNLADIYEALLDDDGRMITSKELKGRIADLEDSYASDPRRQEIAKEKKEAQNKVSPGFTPFTKRRSRWEAQHAKPAKKD